MSDAADFAAFCFCHLNKIKMVQISCFPATFKAQSGLTAVFGLSNTLAAQN